MFHILDMIIADLINNKEYQSLRVIDKDMEICRRYIYKEKGIYKKYTLRLVFQIDDGEWFDKTLRIEIEMTSEKSGLKVKSGYGEDYISFIYSDYKEITKFIISEIIRIQNKNFNIKNNLRGCV